MTYDQTTVLPLVTALTWKGESHAGVVFVSPFTIPQGNVGAMVRALISLWDEEGQTDWSDRTYHLKRA